MPNKLPKIFDNQKICIICEGNEEYEYLKRLNDLKVWNEQYEDIKRKINEQKELLETIESEDCTPSLSQAQPVGRT